MWRDEWLQGRAFLCMTSDKCVPQDRLLREIRRHTDVSLVSLSSAVDEMCLSLGPAS